MNISTFINKYKTSPIQVRASFWYTICNILQKGISFIVVPIYVRLLTTAEYGQYSIFQSWRDVLIIFATFNLYCGVFTKAMVDYDDDRDRYTSCMQGLTTVLTAIMFFVYILKHQFWNSLFSMDTVTMLLLFAYFIFYPAFSFWSVRQRVEYKYGKMVIVTLLVSVATPIISILLLYTTNLRAHAVIWGYLIVQCMIGGIFYVWQFIRGRCFYIRDYWVKALKFNVPLIPHYLSLIVLAQADRIMIQYYCGDEKVGLYNLAYQVSLIMNVIIAAVNNSLVPWSYEKLKERQYEKIRNISTKLCLVIAICTSGIVIIAPEIITILGTREYLEAVWVIPAVAVSVYFTFCYTLFSNIEFYYGETKFVMIASVTGAILNVILNAIFIPMFGFVAAGYTTMVCYLVFMIMHYMFMKKICRKQMGGNKVYNISFIVVSSIVLCMVSAACMLIYGFWILRYLIVLIVLVIIFVKRREVIGILRELK